MERPVSQNGTLALDAADAEATIARLTEECAQLRAALAKVRSMTGYLPGVDPALLVEPEGVN